MTDGLHVWCSCCGRPFTWHNYDGISYWIPCACGQTVPCVEPNFGVTPPADLNP